MKHTIKKSLNRFLSFTMCFFIILETLFGSSSINAHAQAISNDLESSNATNTMDMVTTDPANTIDDKQTIRFSQDAFPDEIFYHYLIHNFDENKDYELSHEEIAKVNKIDVNNLGITSLKGIEVFTNLEELMCRNNQITSLDLASLVNLSKLDCSYNQLTSLDLSDHPFLTDLTCVGNVRAIKMDKGNYFDLSTLDDFKSNLTSWSKEFVLDGNQLSLPDFNDFLLATYQVNLSETTSRHNTLNFSVLFYKNEYSEVNIDETTFPDSVLRELILDSFDKNNDELLDHEELSQITCLDIATYDIKDLRGLQLLNNLVSFNCSNQQSKELDFSLIAPSVIQYVNDEVNASVIIPDNAVEETESSESVESDNSNDWVAPLESIATEEAKDIADTVTDLDIESDSTAKETTPNPSISETNNVSTDQTTVAVDSNPTKQKKTNYTITYQLDGGTNPTNSILTFQGNSNITLPIPFKKGYQFDGWYKDNNFSSLITFIPIGTLTNITVYAKWTQLSVQKATAITKLAASGKGKLTITYPSIEGVTGYEILCSTTKNFKSNIKTTTTSKTSTTVKSLIKNKTYYVKVRGYLIDSSGEKVYGSYSGVKKIKIKSGVEEVKATSSSAKISSCKITNTDSVTVKAKTNKIVKSSDSYYYLFSVPSTQTTLKKLKPVAKTEKSTSVTFIAPLDVAGNNNLLHSKFVIAVKQKSKYQMISSFQYLSNPEGAAKYNYSFPSAPTKKG